MLRDSHFFSTHSSSNDPDSILMFGPLVGLFTLFAQAAPAAAGKADQNPYFQFAPFLAIPFLFYFMVLRPQQLQDRKRKDLIEALKKNDKVLTTAGIYGTVISVDSKADKVHLRLDDDGKVRVTFTRAGILRVLNESVEKSTETK
jgi:preprotein translocase subunit YajC